MEYTRKSFIKDIRLELPDYRFHHKPFRQNDGDNFTFIGRENIRKEFLDTLVHGSGNGAYLVTGYRGMGKTSFVNQVLQDFDTELKQHRRGRLRVINISLGKSDIRQEDLLRQLLQALQQNVLNRGHHILARMIRPSNIIHLSMIIFFFLLLSLIVKNRLPHLGLGIETFLYRTIYRGADNADIKGTAEYVGLALTISVIVAYLFIKGLSVIASMLPTIRIYKRLATLYARSSAEISEEQNIQNILKSLNMGFFNKSITKYPPLSIKEVELQLIDIIKDLDRKSRRLIRTTLLMKVWNNGISFFNRAMTLFRYYRDNDTIFVFDEMDKMEPGMGGNNYFEEMKEYRTSEEDRIVPNEHRERKQMMVSIVSSLKNVIGESNARFIFITGREMFEASLADIADRQYSVGSIFHKIFYVDSFLKDTVGKDKSGLSNVIENHLKHILLPEGYEDVWRKQNNRDPLEEPFLKLYYDMLKYKADPGNRIQERFLANELAEEDILKIIYSLQQFIIFLTYRSNGSPKKVIRIIEELIVAEDPSIPPSTNHHLSYMHVRLCKPAMNRWQRTKRRMIYAIPKKLRKKIGRGTDHYLELTYTNQFRFGFITYLYRPFLLTYSRRIKNYSDYLLVSTTYLVDHILKFHPFAFSTRNLELMPEVLSTNRTPQLRYFIDELLQFLSYSYIRETQIDLFEYKFYNKISNEILYLTNLFEQESAAFNFTLDESYAIKQHIRNKILELRKIHKDFRSQQYEYIHSISALNNLLGDIRFFDQEYTDAITAYSDASQALRGITKPHDAKIEIVLLLIQLQMKLGLTYEKIKSYENALAYFTDAMEYTLKTIKNYTTEPKKDTTDEDPIYARKVSIHELLQVSIHSFTANLYLVEKMSPQGIAIQKIADTYFSLEKILNEPSNLILNANFLVNAATLLFYKNVNLNDLHEREGENCLIKALPMAKCAATMKAMQTIPDKVKDYRFSNISLWINVLALRRLLDHYDNLNKNASKLSERAFSDWLSSTLGRAFEVIMIDSFNEISNKNLLNNFAIVLSRIGDTLLTNITNTSKVYFHELLPNELLNDNREPDFQKWIVKYIAPLVSQGVTGDAKSRINLVLVTYFISGKYYSLGGKIASCSYQYRRILKVITSVVNFDTNQVEENKKVLDFLEINLLREILRNTSTNSNSTDRTQIRKFKYIFGEADIFNSPGITKSLYSNISNNPETREVVIFFAEMSIKTRKIKLETQKKQRLEDMLDEQKLVMPWNIIASQWIRMLELRLQSIINYKIKTEYFNSMFEALWQQCKIVGDDLPILVQWRRRYFPIYARTPKERRTFIKAPGTDLTKLEGEEGSLAQFFRTVRTTSLSDDDKDLMMQFRSLVINSIHSLNHLIGIVQTYGNSYPAGYSFVADAYRYHAKWMIYYYLIKELEEFFPDDLAKSDTIQTSLELLIGNENLRNTEPYGLSQSAQLFYYRTLELHHEGNAYKTSIQTLNYLDDDFSDSMNHFAAALERQRINSGKIREHILSTEKLLQQSQLFRYVSYVNDATLPGAGSSPTSSQPPPSAITGVSLT